MADILTPDICVIGGGSGGLSVAAGAAQMGASTVLIEKGKMGGDCLNFGCVPSKAMLAAAHAADTARKATRFGVDCPSVEVDFARVQDHVAGVIAAIAPHDSVERFEGLGVTVIQAAARFIDARTVEAGGRTIRARRFVVATGSSPMVPPIPGLHRAAYMTNETVFDNRTLPDHLIVIGGGPIGVELAQAHRRLGARVTVLEMATIMPKDDPELAAIVRASLVADGVTIREGVKVVGVAAGPKVTIERADGGQETVEGSHLLVAAGRRANVDGLGLEEAGIDHSRRGIAVDARLRTTNRRVFAIGDVAGPYQFTHMAGYHAGIVIRNALFRLPAKVDYRAVPWVTYTAPELAQVGKTEAEARKTESDIRVLRSSFDENDRAQAERETDGLIKVVTTKRGTILGASIVGAHAGELIQPWALAISKGLKIGSIAGAILPYPTLGEIGKRAAGAFYTPTLYGARTKCIVRLLARLG